LYMGLSFTVLSTKTHVRSHEYGYSKKFHMQCRIYGVSKYITFTVWANPTKNISKRFWPTLRICLCCRCFTPVSASSFSLTTQLLCSSIAPSCIYFCLSTCASSRAHTHAHTHAITITHTHIHTHTYTHIHTHAHTHTHTPRHRSAQRAFKRAAGALTRFGWLGRIER